MNQQACSNAQLAKISQEEIERLLTASGRDCQRLSLRNLPRGSIIRVEARSGIYFFEILESAAAYVIKLALNKTSESALDGLYLDHKGRQVVSVDFMVGREIFFLSFHTGTSIVKRITVLPDAIQSSSLWS